MREIKFRAWDNVEGKWLDQGKIVICNESVYVDGRAFEYGIETDATLEQFTGLLDKNGKEIYEGDIVFVALTGHSYKVEYWDSGWGCYVLVDGDDAYHEMVSEYGDIEVIGNIHEG